MIKFGYTICYVNDVPKAIGFYEQAFQFERKFITPEADYGELATGDTTLAFASHELGNSNLPDGFLPIESTEKPVGIELALVTDNVDKSISQALKHGAKLIKAAEEKPWGQSVGYVRCPSGLLLEICTPIEG